MRTWSTISILFDFIEEHNISARFVPRYIDDGTIPIWTISNENKTIARTGHLHTILEEALISYHGKQLVKGIKCGADEDRWAWIFCHATGWDCEQFGVLSPDITKKWSTCPFATNKSIEASTFRNLIDLHRAHYIAN